MKNLSTLTGLRFLAAFYVFIFHIDMRSSFDALPWYLHNLVQQGSLGVNLFFVLSGFILTYSYYNKTTLSFKEFLAKRFARIYPAFFSGMLAALLVSLVFGHYPKPFHLILPLDTALLNSYVPNLSLEWYGGGSWSISTEFFFYLVFPLLLLRLNRVRQQRTLWLLLALFVCLSALPGMIYNWVGYKAPGPFALVYAFPPARVSEFICGILAGLLVFKFRWKATEWMALGMVGMAVVYLSYIGVSRVNPSNNIVVVPAIVVLLSALANADKTLLLKWIGCRPMEYLGKISYGFYIVQIPLTMYLDLWATNPLRNSPVAYTAAAFFVNLVLAILLYHGVEHPAHRYLTRKIKEHAKREIKKVSLTGELAEV